MRVIDFRHVQTGTLVTRSAHWNKEHCVKEDQEPQLGIITGFKVFEDKVAGVVTYPVIHWEGASFDSMTHPANVALFRKPKTPPQMVDIDPNE